MKATPNRFQSALLKTTAAAVIFVSPAAFAANQYYDINATSGLTAGASTWDSGTTSAWAAITSPGVNAPGLWVANNDAYFQTSGTNTVTLSGTVSARYLRQEGANGAGTTISGGTALQIGAGGVYNNVNTGQPLTINSPVTLTASQTWYAANRIYAGQVITAGGNALTLDANNNGGNSLL
jgi:hypothetical protein